jgi:hypothetical protein
MSWTPHKEAEFQEVRLLQHNLDKEREDYITRVVTPMRVICNCLSERDLLNELAKHAGTLRDLLAPFDARQKPECETVAVSYENFKEVPLTHGGSAFVYRTDYDKVLAQLAAIAQAVKPLRDWYFTGQFADRPDLGVLGCYGHVVTIGDLAKLIDACPRPGSIVDTQA